MSPDGNCPRCRLWSTTDLKGQDATAFPTISGWGCHELGTSPEKFYQRYSQNKPTKYGTPPVCLSMSLKDCKFKDTILILTPCDIEADCTLEGLRVPNILCITAPKPIKSTLNISRSNWLNNNKCCLILVLKEMQTNVSAIRPKHSSFTGTSSTGCFFWLNQRLLPCRSN